MMLGQVTRSNLNLYQEENEMGLVSNDRLLMVISKTFVFGQLNQKEVIAILKDLQSDKDLGHMKKSTQTLIAKAQKEDAKTKARFGIGI